MIHAHHLAKHFGALTAVSDITFAVEPGAVLALLGPNGAGKTTTVRMLSSLLRPSSGHAVVAGHDTVTEAAAVRRGVGMLTEQPALYGRMSAIDYLQFYGALYGMTHGAIAEHSEHLLRYFGIWEHRNRAIGAYSKGMRQKVALARALIHHPRVILLDEPTSAMDPASAKSVRDYILALREDGRTVLICTHNLAEAEALADQIAIISRGTIVAMGAPEELKQRLLGPPLYEIRLRTMVAPHLLQMNGTITVQQTGDAWVQYHAADPARDNATFVRRIVEGGGDVVSVTRVPQSLEAAYLQIVGGQP